MSWFTLPWRSPHPVRTTAFFVVLLAFGILGVVQPQHPWTSAVELSLAALALVLALPEPARLWRGPHPVYSTVGALLSLGLLLAGAFWRQGVFVLPALMAIMAIDWAEEALKPGPLWHRVISLILLVVAVVIGLQALHVLS